MLQRLLLVVALPGLACVACATPPPEPPDIECMAPDAHFAFLDTDTQIFRQGARIGITPSVDVSPAGTRPLAMRCTSGWTITGPARLAADRTSFTIDADAPVGSEIAIRFVHRGEPVERRFRVVGRNAVVLTGRWSQRALEGCTTARPLRELEFGPNGRFSVTFVPFETYRDYWGAYAFDPATGALTLTVAGGNDVPPGLDLEGRAERTGERLTLTGFHFGHAQVPPPAGGCVYSF